ncbi:MAG TPA: phosphoribosylanthranilate isomerase, partial [Vicinamibacterales bacterium]|nr:phosphoribosylanthranilate isomerase [Vicinamibacterales bacterium]
RGQMTPDPILKVCGITRLVDALHALQQGATALGFVFWERSPRKIDPGQAKAIIAALPKGTTAVAVFVNESVEQVQEVVKVTGVKVVQLHGDETAGDFNRLDCPLFRSVTLDDLVDTARGWPAETTFLLDANDRVRRGGTGKAIDWDRAAVAARHHRLVLAGGLTPLNVEEAIRRVRPYGVDVSSGVESSPGIKDFEKVSAFLANARRGFAALRVETL